MRMSITLVGFSLGFALACGGGGGLADTAPIAAIEPPPETPPAEPVAAPAPAEPWSALSGSPGWAEPVDANAVLAGGLRCGAAIDGFGLDPDGGVDGMVIDGGDLTPRLDAGESEVIELSGNWRLEGSALRIDAELVTGDELQITLDPVQARSYREHVFLSGPERTLGCSTTGGYARAWHVEVWGAGAGPEGMDAVAEIAGRALDRGEGFVARGRDADKRRSGVQVRYRPDAEDKAREVVAVLSKDLPEAVVSSDAWPGAPADLVIAVGSEVGGATVSGVVRLTLHGNTPVLAWSPDGRRLATNASFTAEYFMDDEFDTTGVWVVEPATGTITRIADQPAYHPVWVGDRVMFNAGRFETETASGLWWAEMDGEVSMVDAIRAEYRESNYFSPQGLVAGPDGTAFVYFDYGHHRPGWYRYHPADDRFEFLGTGRETDGWAGASWYPPDDAVSQCHAEAGGARIAMDGDRFGVDVGGEMVAIPGSALHEFRYSRSGGFCDEEPEHCGPVRPCLSPDGAYVAWVSRGVQPHMYDVNVMQVR